MKCFVLVRVTLPETILDLVSVRYLLSGFHIILPYFQIVILFNLLLFLFVHVSIGLRLRLQLVLILRCLLFDVAL